MLGSTTINKLILLLVIACVAVLHHQAMYGVWNYKSLSGFAKDFSLIGIALLAMTISVITAKKMNVLQVWLLITLGASIVLTFNGIMGNSASSAVWALAMDIVVLLVGAFVCIFMGNSEGEK